MWTYLCPTLRRSLWPLGCWHSTRRPAAQGNNRQAIADINALFLAAQQLGGDPVLVSTYLAFGLDLFAVEALQAMLANGRMSAQDLAAVRIPHPASLRASLKRTNRVGEAVHLGCCEKVATGQYTVADLGWWHGRCLRGEWCPPAAIYRVFLLGDDLQAQRCYAAEIDWAISRSYWRFKNELPRVDQPLHNNPGGLVDGRTDAGRKQLCKGPGQRGSASGLGARRSGGGRLSRQAKAAFPPSSTNWCPSSSTPCRWTPTTESP